MSDRPEILITPTTVCCPAHGEHLRENWPTGFVTVSMALIKAALESDDLMAAVDPTWDGAGEKARMDEDALNAILAKQPLCYWVTRETIRQAFMESGIGRLGRCKICSHRGLGGPYQMSWPHGVEQSWLCFGCMLTGGERLHHAHPDGGVWTEEASS